MKPLARNGGVRVRLIYLAVALGMVDGLLRKFGLGMEHDTLLVLLGLIGVAIGGDTVRPSGWTGAALEAVTGALRPQPSPSPRGDVSAPVSSRHEPPGPQPGPVTSTATVVVQSPPAAVTSPTRTSSPDPEVVIEDDDTEEEEIPDFAVEEAIPVPVQAKPEPLRVRVARAVSPGRDDT